MFSVENGRASYDESGRFRGSSRFLGLPLRAEIRISAPEGVLPLLVEHPGSYLQEEMRSTLAPPHLLFLHHPLAHDLIRDRLKVGGHAAERNRGYHRRNTASSSLYAGIGPQGAIRGAELGFRVARVLIPGLQPLHGDHRFRFLGGKRLYQVPRILGYTEEDTTEQQLWPWPHPFP